MTFLTTRRNRDLFPLMSSMFDDFFSNAYTDEQSEANKMMPLDVSEVDNELIIKANMPGIKKDNVKVSVHDNELIIEGKQETEKTEKNENIYRYERYKGNYRRVVSLPDVCDIDKVKAKLEDGVLTLNIPKREPVPAKEIKIG